MRIDSRQQTPETPAARFPRLEYRGPGDPMPENVLAMVRFGVARKPSADDVLTIDVGLEPLVSPAPDAFWCSAGSVTRGRAGSVRYAHDDEFLFGVIEESEADHADIRATTTALYAAIDAFQRDSAFPYLVRMWNFIDAVNDGNGDQERYRQFCVGRAEGFGESFGVDYPAATAIGRQSPSGNLQVFWIAAKTPGTAVENPRQLSAYRYPRTHGPVSPSFSRATISPDGTLLISGTASIVGHVSQHLGDVPGQLAETLRNLDSLIAHARQYRASISAQAEMLLTVYVRDPAHADLIAARIRSDFPNDRVIFVAADICRRELLLEIECILQAAQPAE
jgi:chorismate lyase/3-hydroxybenzoate synthase